MRRTKVAIDVNIPRRAVRLLNTGFGDQGFEFIFESDFAPAPATDEFWAAAFRRFGGQIVLSGDKNIAKRPHQILAFQENDLICFFCDRRWASTDGAYKLAHLIYWWPRVQAQIDRSKPRDCWWIPMAIQADHAFRKVEIPTHVKAQVTIDAKQKG